MQGYSDLTFYFLGSRRRASRAKPCNPPPAAAACCGGSPCSAAVVPLGGQSPFARLSPHKAIAPEKKPPRRHAQRQNSLPSLVCFVRSVRRLPNPQNPDKRRRSGRSSLSRFVASSCRSIQPYKAALVAAIRCASGRQSRRPCGARAAGRQAPCPPLYGGPLPSLWPQTSAGRAVCRPLKGVNLCRRRLRRLLVRTGPQSLMSFEAI